MAVALLLLIPITIFCFDNVASFDIHRPSKKFRSVTNKGKDTIVGGYNASIEDFPHQVLYASQTNGGVSHCGAFIVSENYILTAAHCSHGIQPPVIKIYAGSTCPERHQDDTEILAAEVIVHPNYVEGQTNYDIGIIKTVKPIKFTTTMQPIKLPPEGRAMVDNSMITISGWGKTAEGGDSSECLLAVDIPVVNFDKCNQEYSNRLTVNMFCAGEDEGGKDSCQGDSGGAAVQNGMAVGVVSFGNGCARPHSPGVYTHIASPSIRKFIKEHTGL